MRSSSARDGPREGALAGAEQQLRDAGRRRYPADRQTLLEHAARNGAGEDIVKVLRSGPAEQYGGFAEVLRSVDAEEATGQSPEEKVVRARRHGKPIAEHLRAVDEP